MAAPEAKAIETEMHGASFPFLTHGKKLWTPLKNTGNFFCLYLFLFVLLLITLQGVLRATAWQMNARSLRGCARVSTASPLASLS